MDSSVHPLTLNRIASLRRYDSLGHWLCSLFWDFQQKVFHVYLGLASAYLLWRFVPALPVSRKGRDFVAAIVIVTALHFWILQTVSGTMFSSELPRLAIAALGFLFGAFVLLAAFPLRIGVPAEITEFVLRAQR